MIVYDKSVMCICCWRQALQHAGIGIEPEELQRLDLAKCGILVGTAMGGMATFSNAVEDLTVKVCLFWRGFCDSPEVA